MPIDWQALTDNITASLKKSGDTGYSGYKSENPQCFQKKNVPADANAASPLEYGAGTPLASQRVHPASPNYSTISVASKGQEKSVPGVPAVPADFKQGPAQTFDAVSRLRAMSIPDAFWGQRWATMILDAEAFLSSWGEQAKQLGWTELNLFGVHPLVPASRFDVMGLIPLLDGGRVIALTDATATIRKPSGSVQRYARRDAGCAVLIWEVPNAASE